MTKMLHKTLSLCLILSLLASCKKEESNLNQPTTNITNGLRFNSNVFTQLVINRDVKYGFATTQGGHSQDLLMDIYQPMGDTLAQRPLIILAHGGGFVSGEKGNMGDLAEYLTKSGYVVASIGYRLLDINLTTDNAKRAVLDATWDLKAAIRFFRKDAATSNLYRIDANNVFAGGFSAGAFMGLQTAYVNTVSEIQSIGGQALVDYYNNNGGLEGTSGNDGYPSGIKAAINIAGALFKAEYLDAGEPMLWSAHATDDDVVPYLSGDANNTGVITQGSGLIHPEADREGILNKLNTIQGGDHGSFFEDNRYRQDLRQFLYQRLN